MKGKVCLITGATNGIGLETARELAKMETKVVLVGRSAQKAQQVVNQLKEDTGNQHIDYLLADLSLMGQVRKLADEFKAKYERLDVLLNNAGAMFMSKQVTAEGYEMTFALNHLSYFALSHLLLDILKDTAPARIINVSSDAHRLSGRLDFDNLQGEKSYNGLQAYNVSKLENILFTYEMARRLDNIGVTANALHPGLVRSGFGHNNNFLMKIAMTAFQMFGISAVEGAKTSVYLASSMDVVNVNGKYFDKCKAVSSNEASHNREDQKRLWEISEQLTGIKSEI